MLRLDMGGFKKLRRSLLTDEKCHAGGQNTPTPQLLIGGASEHAGASGRIRHSSSVCGRLQPPPAGPTSILCRNAYSPVHLPTSAISTSGARKFSSALRRRCKPSRDSCTMRIARSCTVPPRKGVLSASLGTCRAEESGFVRPIQEIGRQVEHPASPERSLPSASLDWSCTRGSRWRSLKVRHVLGLLTWSWDLGCSSGNLQGKEICECEAN